MTSNKWTLPYKQGENNYLIRYAPQLMANGKYAAKLIIALDYRSGISERPIGIKNNPEFDTELEAAQQGLKAGMEWVRDHG